MQSQKNFAFKTNVVCINDLHVQQLSQLVQRQLTKEQMGDEISHVNRKYEAIRAKQKLVNELKIYLELSKLSEEVLKGYGFDFNKYVELLTCKAYLIYSLFMKQRKNSEEEKQFHRIEVELAYLQSTLNANFIFSIEYPAKELLEIKNSLIARYVKRRLDKLAANVSNEKEKIKEKKAMANDLQLLLLSKKKQLILLEQKDHSKEKTKQQMNMLQNEVRKVTSGHIAQYQSQQQTEDICIAQFDQQTYKALLVVQQHKLQQQLCQLRKNYSHLKQSLATTFLQRFTIPQQRKTVPKYHINPQISSQLLLLQSQLQTLQLTTRKISQLKQLKGETDILIV